MPSQFDKINPADREAIRQGIATALKTRKLSKSQVDALVNAQQELARLAHPPTEQLVTQPAGLAAMEGRLGEALQLPAVQVNIPGGREGAGWRRTTQDIIDATLGLTSPTNVGLAGAMAAAPVTALPISAYFMSHMLTSGRESAKALYQKYKEGRAKGLGFLESIDPTLLQESLMSTGFAGLIGGHGAGRFKPTKPLSETLSTRQKGAMARKQRKLTVAEDRATAAVKAPRQLGGETTTIAGPVTPYAEPPVETPKYAIAVGSEAEPRLITEVQSRYPGLPSEGAMASREGRVLSRGTPIGPIGFEEMLDISLGEGPQPALPFGAEALLRESATPKRGRGRPRSEEAAPPTAMPTGEAEPAVPSPIEVKVGTETRTFQPTRTYKYKDLRLEALPEELVEANKESLLQQIREKAIMWQARIAESTAYKTEDRRLADIAKVNTLKKIQLARINEGKFDEAVLEATGKPSKFEADRRKELGLPTRVEAAVERKKARDVELIALKKAQVAVEQLEGEGPPAPTPEEIAASAAKKPLTPEETAGLAKAQTTFGETQLERQQLQQARREEFQSRRLKEEGVEETPEVSSTRLEPTEEALIERTRRGLDAVDEDTIDRFALDAIVENPTWLNTFKERFDIREGPGSVNVKYTRMLAQARAKRVNLTSFLEEMTSRRSTEASRRKPKLGYEEVEESTPQRGLAALKLKEKTPRQRPRQVGDDTPWDSPADVPAELRGTADDPWAGERGFASFGGRQAGESPFDVDAKLKRFGAIKFSAQDVQRIKDLVSNISKLGGRLSAEAVYRWFADKPQQLDTPVSGEMSHIRKIQRGEPTQLPSMAERLSSWWARRWADIRDKTVLLPTGRGFGATSKYAEPAVKRRILNYKDIPLLEKPAIAFKLAMHEAAGMRDWATSGITRRFQDASREGLREGFETYLNLRLYARNIRIQNIKADELSRSKDASLVKEAAGLRAKIEDGSINPEHYNQTKVDRDLAKLSQTLGPERMRRVEQLANEVYSYTARALDDAFEADLLSKEAYDRFKSYGSDYLSLNRIIEDARTTQPYLRGNSFDLKNLHFVKELSGAELVNLPPLEATLRVIQTLYQDRGRQLATRPTIHWAKHDPAWAADIRELKPGEQPTPTEIAIGYIEAGKPKSYAVPKDSGLAFVAQDPLAAGIARNSYMRWVTGQFRKGTTIANLGFSPMNFPRDIVRAVYTFNLKDFDASKLDIPSIQRFGQLWWKGFKEELLDVESPEREIFYRSGTANSTFTRAFTPDLLTTSKRGVIEDLAKLHLIDASARFNNAIEAASKRATYELAKEGGVPETEATWHAIQYGGSPDFMSESRYRQFLNVVLPYASAGMAGLSADMQFISDNPKYIVKSMAVASAAYAALAAWNYSFVDDTGEPLIDRIPDEERNRNFIIVMPRQYAEVFDAKEGVYGYKETPIAIRIPKAQMYQMLMNPLEHGMNAYMGERALEGWKEIASAASNLLPGTFSITPETASSDIVRGLASTVTPALRMPAEQLANIKTFEGGPIEPRRFEGVEPAEIYSPTTSPTLREVAKGGAIPGAGMGGLLGAMFGGAKGAAVGAGLGTLASQLPISPMRTEYAIESTFGGLGREAIKVGDLATAQTKELAGLPADVTAQRLTELERLRATPVVGSVYGRLHVGPMNQKEQELTQKFYAIADEIHEAENTFNMLRRERPEQIQTWLDQDDNRTLVSLIPATTEARNRIAQILGIERRIWQDPNMTNEEKIERMKGLFQHQILVLQRMTDALETRLGKKTND